MGEVIIMYFSKEYIRSLCTSTIYARGYDYFSRRRVMEIYYPEERRVYAQVKGSYNNFYSTNIYYDSNYRLTKYSCTCPAHHKYPGPCKHVIALMLLISSTPEQNREEKKPEPKPIEHSYIEPPKVFSYEGMIESSSKEIPIEQYYFLAKKGDVESQIILSNYLYNEANKKESALYWAYEACKKFDSLGMYLFTKFYIETIVVKNIKELNALNHAESYSFTLFAILFMSGHYLKNLLSIKYLIYIFSNGINNFFQMDLELVDSLIELEKEGTSKEENFKSQVKKHFPNIEIDLTQQGILKKYLAKSFGKKSEFFDFIDNYSEIDVFPSARDYGFQLTYLKKLRKIKDMREIVGLISK